MRDINEYISNKIISLLNEYLLNRNTKSNSKYIELDENMHYDDVVCFFIDKGYEMKECDNTSDFFDPDIKEQELLIFKKPIGNNIRFKIKLAVYKLTFSSTNDYITDIFVIDEKSSIHYHAPNNVWSIQNVLDEINNYFE